MEVEHQVGQNRFVMNFGEQMAVLDYVLAGNRVDFNHTYVPFSLRGKGYAEKLVSTALNWARENTHEIHASCWYVRKFLVQ